MRNPRSNAIPGLDVLPLREHAWLDLLADVGVFFSMEFYNRLVPLASPSHPPVIDLGFDNNLIATV